MKTLTELERLQILESSVCQKGIKLPRIDVRQVVCFNTNPKSGSGCLLSTKHHVTCYWEDGSVFLGIQEDPIAVLWVILRYLDEKGDREYRKHKDAIKVYETLGNMVCVEMPNFLYDLNAVQDVTKEKPKSKRRKVSA